MLHIGDKLPFKSIILFLCKILIYSPCHINAVSLSEVRDRQTEPGPTPLLAQMNPGLTPLEADLWSVWDPLLMFRVKGRVEGKLILVLCLYQQHQPLSFPVTSEFRGRGQGHTGVRASPRQQWDQGLKVSAEGR